MPTAVGVDAPEPEASGNVGSMKNDGGSGKDNPEPSDDDHCMTSGENPVVDKTINSNTNETGTLPKTHNEFNSTQDDVFDAARRNMTTEQRALTDRRMERVTFELPRNPKEQSQKKGKGIDPSNWGNLQLEEAEADPLTQEALLSEYNSFQNEPEEQLTFQEEGPEYDDWQSAPEETRDTAIQPTDDEEHDQGQDPDVFTYSKKRASAHKKRKDRAGSLPLSDELGKLIRKVAEGSSKKAKYKPVTKKTKNKNGRDRFTKPISQVSTKSALGRALAQLAPGPESSSSSSSESDSGDGSPSSDTDDSDSGSNSPSSDESEEEHQEKRSKRKQKHRKRTLIKPTPPNKYGGQADLRAFHKFLTHGTAYVKYGYVERRRQVMVLSEFLTGRAYTFYTQQVSINPERWTLQKFFTELFNYCFPIDFRNQQRTKLSNFSQGNRSVREYVADLDELFTIVGADSKQSRVVKLFNGFRAPIRKALLREHLNPELTTWKTMVREAEYQEMAENVDTRDNANQGYTPTNRGPRQDRGNQKRFNSQDYGKNQYHSDGRRPRNSSGPVTDHGRRHPPSQRDKASGKNPPRMQSTPRAVSSEEKQELKDAGKCFICRREGHFSRNCPERSKQTSGSNKPPGLSANSIRLRPKLDLEQTEQLRIDSLGETTTSLSIGMMDLYRFHRSSEEKITPIEYDSDGDTIPDLQSISDSDEELCDDNEDPYVSVVGSQQDTDDESDLEESDNELGPAKEFNCAYPYKISDGDEKLIAIEVEEGPRQRLGQAVAWKAEDMLEILQPYSGDSINILQYQGRRFRAFEATDNQILIQDVVHSTMITIDRYKVANAWFPLGEWYAQIASIRAGVPLKHRSRFQTLFLTKPMAWNARKVLESGILYPMDVGPRGPHYHRFQVNDEGEMHHIYNHRLKIHIQIESRHLKNARFDLYPGTEREYVKQRQAWNIT
ncbi:hypothetical protein C0993_006576 [Termitomyces sp. T159_Od127]|nr:hypothetical protein C0993_006576 [Termitomyces sp. T159_Od127]